MPMRICRGAMRSNGLCVSRVDLRGVYGSCVGIWSIWGVCEIWCVWRVLVGV